MYKVLSVCILHGHTFFTFFEPVSMRVPEQIDKLRW